MLGATRATTILSKRKRQKEYRKACHLGDRSRRRCRSPEEGHARSDSVLEVTGVLASARQAAMTTDAVFPGGTPPGRGTVASPQRAGEQEQIRHPTSGDDIVGPPFVSPRWISSLLASPPHCTRPDRLHALSIARNRSFSESSFGWFACRGERAADYDTFTNASSFSRHHATIDFELRSEIGSQVLCDLSLHQKMANTFPLRRKNPLYTIQGQTIPPVLRPRPSPNRTSSRTIVNSTSVVKPATAELSSRRFTPDLPIRLHHTSSYDSIAPVHNTHRLRLHHGLVGRAGRAGADARRIPR